MKKKQFEHDYLMPFIDFAFMVIIIFIALLSVAYFTPPGLKPPEVVKVVKPLVSKEESIKKEEMIKERIKEIEYLKTKLRTKRDVYEKEIRDLKADLKAKEEMITHLKKEISMLKEQLEKKVREVETLLGYGKHEFTDLRE